MIWKRMSLSKWACHVPSVLLEKSLSNDMVGEDFNSLTVGWRFQHECSWIELNYYLQINFDSVYLLCCIERNVNFSCDCVYNCYKLNLWMLINKGRDHGFIGLKWVSTCLHMLCCRGRLLLWDTYDMCSMKLQRFGAKSAYSYHSDVKEYMFAPVILYYPIPCQSHRCLYCSHGYCNPQQW